MYGGTTNLSIANTELTGRFLVMKSFQQRVLGAFF